MQSPRFLDQTLFADLAGAASANPRGRQHHNLHQMEEPCHRMVVGMQPSTYVPPHRHVSADKAECLLVLKGKLGILLFDETGVLVSTTVLQAAGDVLGVDIPPGFFHALVVLEPDSIMFECKAGPYLPVSPAELADWAPHEGDPGVADYHAWMMAQFA